MMSVRLSLKILVTTEPIGIYSSGNIPPGPVVFLGYLDTLTSQKTKKIPLIFFKISSKLVVAAPLFFKITSWGKASRV